MKEFAKKDDSGRKGVLNATEGGRSYFSVKIERKNRCDGHVLESQHKRGGGRERKKGDGRMRGKEGEQRSLQRGFPIPFPLELLLGQPDKPRTGTGGTRALLPLGPGPVLPGPDPLLSPFSPR